MSCCGSRNKNVQAGMYNGPFFVQNDIPATALNPRIKPYSGWASYKNVKSGNYNRQLCWPCGDFQGYPQTPGFFDQNIVDSPVPMPNVQQMEIADKNYIKYQRTRMQSNDSEFNKNYLNGTTCSLLYPKKYVKGNWPDEQLIYTNTPRCANNSPTCTTR